MFNCSFQFKRLKLNKSLLLGPVLSLSEKAYCSVAGLHSEDTQDNIQITLDVTNHSWPDHKFPRRNSSLGPGLNCCSHWCPVCQPSQKERTIPISQTVHWTDSMTMLNWTPAWVMLILQKSLWVHISQRHVTWVFMWCGVTQPMGWSQDPAFLRQHPSQWPVKPVSCHSPYNGGGEISYLYPLSSILVTRWHRS